MSLTGLNTLFGVVYSKLYVFKVTENIPWCLVQVLQQNLV